MPLSVDIRKVFRNLVTTEVVDTPGDQFGRYLHQLGIYRDLIEENKQSVMNPDLGVLYLSEYERNRNNIIDLTARIAESRQGYKEPELVTQRKLLGVIPLGKRRWFV